MSGLSRIALLLILPAIAAALPGDGKQSAKPADASASGIGRRVPNFVLPNTTGKQVGLADYKDRHCVVVVFLGTKCPVANAYVPALLDLQKTYADKHVQVIGINANPGDSEDAIRQHVKEFGITFPVLIDPEQTTLSLFGARRTPEAFVLDGRGTIRYHGRIDDRIAPDYKREQARRADLREALDDVLAGQEVRVKATDAAGCLITRAANRKPPAEITYAKDVAPILQKHCVDCHHPGTAAPFSLLTYQDAADWSEMIGEVVAQRRMPPWHADPRFGHFANERRLSTNEIETLTAWIAAGAPEGAKNAAPPLPPFAEGWRIGKPDVVFKLPEEFTVQATGTVRYKYFTTPTDFKDDVWIQAAEPRPGNRAVVHHIIVWYKDPKATGRRVWIASMAPGEDPVIFPDGFGRKIPAGAELVWQMHYTPTGKEEKDRSEIGLVFCKQPPKHNVMNHGIANMGIKIPAGDGNHEVVATQPVVRDSVLLQLHPHMHLRGKDFEYQVIYPGGRKEVILSVPQYDFNWQTLYRFQEPLRLPKGAEIRCVAHYDNSAANPANPDPKKEVRWGDQTWDEMMIGFIDFYCDEAGEKKD